MCLGVPGRITEIWQQLDGPLLARADFNGEVRTIKLDYMPDLVVGDHMIVHAGYALTRIGADEADRTLAMMREVGLLDEAPLPAPLAQSAPTR